MKLQKDMETKILQSFNLIRRGSGASLNLFRYAAMLLCLLTIGVGKMWGTTPGYAYMKAQTADPAKGLVYMNNNGTAPTGLSSYKRYHPGGSAKDDGNEGCYVKVGEGNGPHNNYYWAIAARGYKFKTWDGFTKEFTATLSENKVYMNQPEDQAKWNGDKDLVKGQAGGQANTWVEVEAKFDTVAKYTVTYGKPVGGSYSVSYSYLMTRPTTGEEYELYVDNTESYSMTPSSESSDEAVVSYRTDEITLTVPNEATNFIGWYEGSSQVSTSKTYKYTAHADVTICPIFKELAWGDVSGDLTTNVTAKGTYGGKTVYVAIPTLIGSWEASEFTVAPMSPSNDFGSIAIGTISLDKTSNPNRLVIPYTYTATNWGGIEATLTITPSFGATKEFSIACSAEEIVDYEACVEENGVRTYTGTLADMMTQANGMNKDNKPVLKLMQNKTITSPLSFLDSFTFDVNGKVLTANCASAFSIDAAGKDVKIIDGSFTQVGEIHTSNASSGVVSVVTFTQAAKLTMQGGTLSAENTGTGSAYGVNVCNGSIFFMSNGQLTVTGVSGAQGVHVATADDYATLNGGSIAVSAPTKAYGLWSAGQSNITDATIDVEATTGAKAYGVYVNGGTSTLTTTTITADAKTTEAYGACVNAGRLNGNGGSFAATAVTSGVYGVHVAADATAMIQMNAVVTAEATGASGTSVFGVNNLGTVSLTNVSVTANAATNATAVNTVSSATSTTIEGGTYRANTTGGTAYGLHHQYGTLNVDGGTFRAVGGGNSIYGARAVANGTIANATLHGETTGSGNTAYGFVGGVAGKTIALAGCTIKGVSNTSKAYAIYSRAIVTATGCTLTATAKGTSEAYGLYAENGTNALANCNATVSANTIKAYGVNHVAGDLTISGGQYDVEAKQDGINNAQNTELYGLRNAASKTTTVEGAIFNVTAKSNSSSQYIYGAYIDGTLNSSNSTYVVSGKTIVYGIYGLGSSTLTLAGNTVSTTVINGTASYGIYAQKNFTINGDIVSAQGNAKGVYALFFDKSTSIGEVLDGKFSAMGNGTNDYGPLNATGTVGSVKLKGGVAKMAANLKKYVYTGYDVYTIDNTHPDYAAGYRYAIAAGKPSQYVCYIKNGNKYESLAAALQYTKDNDGTYTIIMTQNDTLHKGDYELPSNATLIIPRDISQTTLNTNVPKDEAPVVEMIEEHLRLTMASGAHLNVSGKIEVGGKLYSQEYGKISYNNSPYARIYMETGSLMQLNNGARLYAWGFISGTGSITAKSGSEVHEMFQVGDMKAISPLGQHYISNSAKFFPVQTYSIQNIEVPTTYYYNSQLITTMYEYNPGNLQHGYNGEENIKLIGKQDAMFLVTSNDESSWVRKSYSGGKQIYEVNSSAKLGSLIIDVGSYTMDSRDYILPITATMKIHVLDGSMEITQSTMFQPGTEVEINKTATLKINAKDSKNNDVKVYLVDQHQWMSNTSNPDAAWNVHGKIDVQGYLYTTNKGKATTKTDGANIYSNNTDAGTISFSKAVSSSTSTLKYMMSDYSIKDTIVDPAKLKNGDGMYVETAGTGSGESWVYMNNEWVKTYTNGCFEVLGSTVYAKPSGYVALKKSQTDANSKLTGVEEANHTYLTADDKILILMDDCQWWEVVATSDPAVFECTKTGYEGFYYYDNTTSKWKLKTVNVKFYSAETGDNVLKTIVTDYNGIPDQAVIASNPTKATTAEYTYAFYGWKSSVTDNEYSWTAELEQATADMSYRPVFTETKRNYTITLNDANNGAAAYLEVPYGEMPSYEATKSATAEFTYSFDTWSPALETVTGPASYTALWNSIKNRYTITWMNADEVLEEDKNQLYGTATAYNGALPTKDADNDYEYEFSGWLSSLTGVTYTNGSTPTIGGTTTYTAQFNTTPRYMITFANYDGSQLQKEPVTQGETPIYNGVTPARARDLDGYYIFTGWKRNSTGVNYAPNAALPAATQKETYTAQYSYTNDLFLITLNNVDGNGASWSGKFGEGSTPFYAPDPNNPDIPVIPAKEGNDQYEYEFTGWDPALVPVTTAATYTAVFAQHTKTYTITFANVDGNGASRAIEAEYGSTPICPVVPTKGDNYYTYDFLGWDNTIVAVTGDATYTAQFSGTGTPRTFTITFEPENGGAAQVLNVAYGQTPTPTATSKAADAQYTYEFAGWYPALEAVSEDATYYAQYTQTLNSYTVTFVVREETVATSTKQYGTAPTKPAEPKAWVDEEHDKVYSFAGWSDGANVYAHNAIPNVQGDVTYTAQYAEFANLAATVTVGGVTTPYDSWSTAYSNRATNCTIKLYKDVTGITSMQALDKSSMTLDLNGYTISGTCASSRGIVSSTAANVTITDSSEGKTGTISGSGNFSGPAYTLYVNGGSLTIDYASVSTNNSRTKSTSNAYGVNLNSGSVVINDGKFKATSGYSRGTKSAVYIKSGTTTTIKGGYYSNSVTAATGYSCNATSELSGYTHKVTPATYTLSYTLNGGSVTPANPATYTIETATFTLNNPTRTGYDFAGWTGSNGSTPQKSVSVNLGSTGDKSYTANWTPRNDTHYTVKHYKQQLDGTYSATPDDTDNLQGTTAMNVTPETKNYTGFTAPSTQTEAIAADGSMVIEYQYTRNSYELTWDANGGTIAGEYTNGNVLFESPIIAPNAANVTRAGHTFISWNETPATTMPATDKTYTAQYELPVEVVAADGETVEITTSESTVTTIVEEGGTLMVETGNTLTTDHLILVASVNNSGEITGGGDVTVTPVTGNVYFDLTLNTWGRHWHSFGVPWQVDLDEHQLVEVKNKNGEPCNRPLVLDVDFDIVWYNGQTRADHHGYVPACWEYIVDYTDDRHAQLYPGKAYMIGFASAVGTVRFVKKSGAPIFYNDDVEVMENGYSGDDVNGGWNAIANPKVYHTLMSGLTGVSFAQVHKSDTIGADTYQPCSLDDHKFVVGMAVYVQAQETQPVTINKAGSQTVISAPHRRVQGTQDINTVMRCEVEIAPEGGKMADRIYVQPEDEKEDRYVAGKDVSKMGVSGKRAQMWIERYGQKLCVNTVAPVNDKANYPLSVYAPADGNYSIYLNNQPSDDITLYLTYDGRAIWNLSSGEYVATLNKGTDTHYGLRIVRKTPEAATGIEETTILNGDAVRKVIVDDKIFVIRGNNVYSIDGQLIR